ncbi:hypothetical protein ROA7450_02209 [Roseovarius albus]|uniref:Uncharacterized protein n=1 Tax=Roseovarius albus TaxID=1247867 RepID=A0A1X6Z9X1_9RHOB|nr:hypothetical protein ROA7450_02209 [Roseovarius albus]
MGVTSLSGCCIRGAAFEGRTPHNAEHAAVSTQSRCRKSPRSCLTGLHASLNCASSFRLGLVVKLKRYAHYLVN